MSREFGLVAKMEHYGCVKAYDFINKMPFEADAIGLGALMGACRLHGAIELGNEVAQLLLESQQNHFGIMCNYIMHLCWRIEDVSCCFLEKSYVN
ncbi:hypothetical protein R3W88_000746 [Solanum pinnatisectum]|uniref:Pentatricopeptide repeat-containing protein n=1 Tax=Solanum pinnatisectum TaxID=50273 RepID=A0AAV9MGK4_9SOLN|nr:hypothetical protein R3W88_000746 [Solanum pinnatisectum]